MINSFIGGVVGGVRSLSSLGAKGVKVSALAQEHLLEAVTALCGDTVDKPLKQKPQKVTTFWDPTD